MEAEMIRLHEAAEMLGMSERRARIFLETHGLLPFDVCVSQRHGRKVLRWSIAAVRALIDTLQTGAKPTCADVIPRRRDSIRIAGRTAKEVYAMYAR